MKYLALAVLLIGCTSDVDEPWQLDHDRIIAVRATPPRIPAGAMSELDTLVGRKAMAPSVESPPGAQVVSPQSLASTLTLVGTTWTVTAPDEARLAAVRIELGLAVDAPVPLVVGVGFPPAAFPGRDDPDPIAAIKTVWLGANADNPAIADSGVTVDGALADPQPALTIPMVTDVPLSITVADTDDVNWLTSCGTMHDFDLPQAYIRVEPADPTEGSLAVVVRTSLGGVAWRVWPIHAE